MADQFLYQCINKYLTNLLQAPLENPLYDYPNLLIKLFVETKQMFHNIQPALLKYFREQFMLLDYQSNRNPSNLFTKMLIFNDQPALDYCQILIRLIILGLSLKQGLQPKQFFWNHKLNKLINDCQLNLVFHSSGQTFSSLLKTHLQLLASFFDILDFYQRLRKLFVHKELDMLIEWTNIKIQDLKKKSSVKTFRDERTNYSQKNRLRIKTINRQPENSITQTVTALQLQNKKQNIKINKKNVSVPKQQKLTIVKNQNRRKSLSRTLYFERKHPHSVIYKTVIQYEDDQLKQQERKSDQAKNTISQKKCHKNYFYGRKTTI